MARKRLKVIFASVIGVRIDWKLNFGAHISNVCKKASGKLNVLARIAPFIWLSKKCILMKPFFNSQLSYCPLIWMYHSRTNNRKINRLHERWLRIIYNDKQPSFSKLLEKYSSVSVHMINIRSLAIEIFRASRNISPPSCIIFSSQRATVGITWNKFLNFEDRWWSQYIPRKRKCFISRT